VRDFRSLQASQWCSHQVPVFAFVKNWESNCLCVCLAMSEASKGIVSFVFWLETRILLKIVYMYTHTHIHTHTHTHTHMVI